MEEDESEWIILSAREQRAGISWEVPGVSVWDGGAGDPSEIWIAVSNSP